MLDAPLEAHAMTLALAHLERVRLACPVCARTGRPAFFLVLLLGGMIPCRTRSPRWRSSDPGERQMTALRPVERLRAWQCSWPELPHGARLRDRYGSPATSRSTGSGIDEGSSTYPGAITSSRVVAGV